MVFAGGRGTQWRELHRARLAELLAEVVVLDGEDVHRPGEDLGGGPVVVPLVSELIGPRLQQGDLPVGAWLRVR